MNHLKKKSPGRTCPSLFRICFCICMGLFATMTLLSCASVGRKFESTPKANVGIFADNSMAMLADLDLAMQHNETIRLRRFLNYAEPEEKKMAALSEQMHKRLIDVVKYSVYLVHLAESNKSEAEKVADYSDYLSGYRNKLKSTLDIPADHLDASLAQIRQQKDLLGAFREAQPIINAVGFQSSVALNELIQAIEAVSSKLDRKIDSAYADVIRYEDNTETEKLNILKSLELLYNSYRGDNNAMTQLKASGTVLDHQLLPKANRPTHKELQALSDHLVKRLDYQHKIQREIEPELKAYRETHQELIQIQGDAVKRISRYRTIMLVWVRAHQKMASGLTDPAEWFDLKETPKFLLDLGKDAVF